MAAAATAVKLHARISRLQEAAVVLQERSWVQEAVGDLTKRGKFLLDVIATKSSHHAPSLGAAIVGSSGLLLPSPSMKSASVTPHDRTMESLMANLAVERTDHGSSKLKLQLVEAPTAAGADLGHDGQGVRYTARKVGPAKTERRSPLVQSMKEEDYGWETDPNGGWLASFP